MYLQERLYHNNSFYKVFFFHNLVKNISFQPLTYNQKNHSLFSHALFHDVEVYRNVILVTIFPWLIIIPACFSFPNSKRSQLTHFFFFTPELTVLIPRLTEPCTRIRSTASDTRNECIDHFSLPCSFTLMKRLRILEAKMTVFKW